MGLVGGSRGPTRGLGLGCLCLGVGPGGGLASCCAWFAGCYGAAVSPPSRRLGGSGVRFGFLLCLLGQPVSRVVC